MIVYGTRDFSADLPEAPTVDLADRSPLELSDGSILQVLSELSFSGFENRVPPALHPSHPPFCSMIFYAVPDGPHGGFTMATVRVSSLAGISRFGYAVRGWIDNPSAGGELGRRFGYHLHPADVRVTRRHDRVWGTVEVDGDTVLQCGMIDPEPVSGQDANHAGQLNLAYVASDEGDATPMLLHTGPQLNFARCDRGTPFVEAFDERSIGCDAPYWPISAFAGSCDFRFEPVSFMCDPAVPPVERRLAGSMQPVGQR